MSINRDQLARHYCKTVTAMAALLNRIGTLSLPVERKIHNTQYYNKQQAFKVIDAYLENRYKGSTGRPRTREQEVFFNAVVLHISRETAFHCIKERVTLRTKFVDEL
jgi:hypothetical protein